MPQPLPARASLDWLKKTAKQNLRALRESNPDAKLAEAQRLLARDYGFPSWRALKAHVEADEPRPVGEEEVAAFLRAVGDGAIETVRAALGRRPQLVNAVGRHPFWGGRPQPLHVAIETKRRDVFDVLLEAGAEPSGRNEEYDHWSPLMLACHRNQPGMVQALVDRGAHVGLVEALMMKDDRRVEELLRHGLPAATPSGGSVLAFARSPFAVDRLLELGASPELPDRWGKRPVEAFAALGPEGRPLLDRLLSRGVAAAPEDYARIGDRERLESLASRDPAALRADAVLIAAVEAGDRALVAWLIGQGASPNARTADEARRTALHNAAWGGDLEMAKLLVSAGADVGARDAEHNDTPLGWAQTSIRISNNPDCIAVAEFIAAVAPG